MRCHVYRCSRRAGTYVYLAGRDRFDRLPLLLREQFGVLEWLLEIDLDGPRRLAQQDPGVVRANLAASGFHVQFPPSAQAVRNDG